MLYVIVTVFRHFFDNPVEYFFLAVFFFRSDCMLLLRIPSGLKSNVEEEKVIVVSCHTNFLMHHSNIVDLNLFGFFSFPFSLSPGCCDIFSTNPSSPDIFLEILFLANLSDLADLFLQTLIHFFLFFHFSY